MFIRRSSGAGVAAAFVVVLVGCTNYVGESEYQARLEVASYSGWIRAKADARDETLREIGKVEAGRLKQGDEVTLPLEVTGAHEAVIIAACDDHCSDLDLRVVTDDGRLIGLDEEDDDYPRVEIDAGKTNSLKLRVRMVMCTSSSCSFAFSQLEYEDYAGGSGTCFAVSPDGLLMTSLHVVDGASKISVVFPDGRRGEATLLRRSKDNDLAVLRANIATPVWLPLAAGSEIIVGMQAFTAGFPSPRMLGSEVKFTEGNISSLSGYDEEPTLMQVSIPIQPGNSGGPVLSYSGRVLGVIEASVDADSNGTPMQLTNFARNARVAALLLPSQTKLPTLAPPRSREQAVERALKAVCQVKAE
jgi:hypothetical protein